MKKPIILIVFLALSNLFCKRDSISQIENKSELLTKSSQSVQQTNATATVSAVFKSDPLAQKTVLQDLINSYATKKEKLILPAGKFTISDEIILPSNLWIEGSGAGTEIILTGGNRNGRNVFKIPTRTNNITIKNLSLNANQQNNTGADLVALYVTDNTSNLTFERVTFNGGRDRGAVQVKGLNAYPVKSLKFLNCKFPLAGRTSLELRGTADVTVTDCVFSGWGSLNANSPAIQLQSQDNNRVLISNNVFNNEYGKQFAIECAAAYVNDSKIINNELNDNKNIGGNGISGYFKRTEISKNKLNGGVGNQRSGLEIFGQYNTISFNTIAAGNIAIAPGLNEKGMGVNINNNQIKTQGANVGGIQMGHGCCEISDVKIVNNLVDTRQSSGNSSGIVVGTYGKQQKVSNIIVEANTIFTNAHCIRLEALPGSKDIYLNRNICKAGYSWLGIITNTFQNIKAVGNVKELSNKQISYSNNVAKITEL